MDKRVYIDVRPITQYGKLIGQKLYGERTSVYFIPKLQGIMTKGKRLISKLMFSITFHDTGLIVTSRAQDADSDDWLYVKYALEMVKENNLEEYYKVALFITKKRLTISTQLFEQIMKDYSNTGLLPYYLFGKLDYYRSAYKIEKETLKTLDIKESDLTYIDFFKETLDNKIC